MAIWPVSGIILFAEDIFSFSHLLLCLSVPRGVFPPTYPLYLPLPVFCGVPSSLWVCVLRIRSSSVKFSVTPCFFPALPARFIEALRSQEALESSTVTLRCELSKKAPVVWRKGSETLRNGARYSLRQDGAVCELEIHDLTVEDTGEYSCTCGQERTSATLSIMGKCLLWPHDGLGLLFLIYICLVLLELSPGLPHSRLVSATALSRVLVSVPQPLCPHTTSHHTGAESSPPPPCFQMF